MPVLLLVAFSVAQAQEASQDGRTVSQWIELLRAGDEPARERAVDALWDLAYRRVRMEGAAAALADALADSSPRVAARAASALRRLRPDGVAGQLVAATRHADDRVREAALQALAEIPSARGEAVPALLAALDDPSAAVRGATCWSLGQMQPFPADAVGALVLRLQDPVKHVRSSAAHALGRAGADGTPAIPALTAVYERDADVHVRRGACWALERLDPQGRPEPRDPEVAPEAVLERLVELAARGDGRSVRAFRALEEKGLPALPAVKRLLEHPNATVRAGAAGALGRMGEAARGGGCEEPGRDFVAPSDEDFARLVAPLTALLSDADARVRGASCRALGALRDHAGPAVPQLGELVADPDAGVREAAIQALLEVGRCDGVGLEGLLDGLRAPEVEERARAASALGRFERHRARSVPALWPVVESDPSPLPRLWALRSLLELGEPRDRCVAALVARVLQAEDSEVRADALGLVAELGADALPSLPAVLAALEDDDPDVRLAAIVALGALRARGERVVEALVARLEDEEQPVRYAALERLACLQAAAAVPAVARWLGADDSRDRDAASEALGRIGAPSAPVLAAALAQAPAEDAVSLILALDELGPEAAPAVPALLALLASDDAVLRRLSCDALASICEGDVQPVPALLRRVEQEQDAEVRFAVLDALGALGLMPDEVVPVLVRIAADPDDVARYVALPALEAFGPAAAVAVHDVASLLRDHERCYAAAGLLLGLGEHAAPAARAMERALELDPTCACAPALRLALAALRGELHGAVAAVASDLASEVPRTRAEAARLLGRLGARAAPAVPALLDAAMSSRGVADEEVVEALGRIGADPERCVPVLVSVLRDDLASARRSAAATALGRFGSRARAAVPALEEAVASGPWRDVRQAARGALRAIRRAE